MNWFFGWLQARGRRPGIAFKLYCVAGLSAIAVAALSISAYHFARSTEAAARNVYQQSFPGLERSARLQTLLEQYRRVVETAPAEVDRTRLQASERAMLHYRSELLALTEELSDHKSNSLADPNEERFAKALPPLFDLGQRVLFYAYNFAQDKALEAAVQHAKTADQFQELIRAYREQQMTLADSAIATLFESAEALILWVAASAIAAFILIGPLGLAITRGVLSRLTRITNYMTRLAQDAQIEKVPSSVDQDEVGDMARAVEVFKNHAIELQDRKVQLESVIVQLDVALNNMTHGLCMFNAERRLIVCNTRYAEMFNLPQELTKPGTLLQRILDFRMAHGSRTEHADAAHVEEFSGGTQAFTVTEELPDGRVIAISRQPMPDGGWVAVYEDVTERLRAEARIAYLAKHDQLTELPNRVQFREQFDKALKNSAPTGRIALLCLDLDGFKAVNDSLGHPIGDQLLKIVAQRLRKCLTKTDLAARLGGDEFAVVQCGSDGDHDGGLLASRIIEAVSAPYVIEGKQIIINGSIGIALAPQDGEDADVLLQNADMAMYCAKIDRRGSYQYFSPAMRMRIEAKRSLELELRRALTEGRLDVHYQPVVDSNGNVRSFEALTRWFHPQSGEIPPAKYIPIAEESGLITALGEWTLRTACTAAATWPRDIKIAINLSPRQFTTGNIVQTVISALANTGLAADRLEIEITETVFLENNANTISILRQLHELGVRIIMDDFGTGYSSLSYLRSFPFDKLKIDRSFVEGLGNTEESLAIVRAILMLAKSLQIGVVAEGVETAEQFRILRSEGCEAFQGFFFSRPESVDKISSMLARCNRQIAQAA